MNMNPEVRAICIHNYRWTLTTIRRMRPHYQSPAALFYALNLAAWWRTLILRK